MLPDEFRQGWRTLLASVIGAGTGCLVLTTYSIGIFVRPMETALTWSRQDILLSSTFLTIGVLVTSFLIGWLADRFPLRTVIIVFANRIGCCFVCRGRCCRAALDVLSDLSCHGGGGGRYLADYIRPRIVGSVRSASGLAIGIALAGTGLTGILLPPYVSYFVEHYGWRAGYYALGAIPIGLALPVSVLLLDRNIGLAREGSTKTGPTTHLEGVTLAEALCDRRFWLMAAGSLLGASASNGLVANLIPLIRDHGASADNAKIAMSLFGIAVICGRIGVGRLVDRFWAPPIAFLVMVPAGIATIFLAQPNLGFGMSCFFVVLVGFAAGAEFDLVTYLITRYFGVETMGESMPASMWHSRVRSV